MVKKFTFNTFGEALNFLEAQRKEGLSGIYYPEKGGDNPRRLITDTPVHAVIVYNEEVE